MNYLIRSKQKWVLPILSKSFRSISAIVFLSFFWISAQASTYTEQPQRHPERSEGTPEQTPVKIPKTSPSKKKREVSILPLITIYDVQKDATYNWWSETETESIDARKHSEQFMSALSKENGKILRFLNPYTKNVKFRENLQKTVLSAQELLAITNDLGTELVLTGDVVVDKSPVLLDGQRLKINMQILRAPAFNQVGEVYRVVDVYSVDYTQMLEVGGDVWPDVRLAIEKQIEAYKPPTSKSEKLELIVNGTFDHQQLQQFRRFLRGTISNIKEITPGFLERDSFGIFVEYAGKGTESLSKELRETKLEGFMTQVVSSTNSQVIFDVRPVNKVK
ncbi:MAG: hypothetical protein IT287_09755 [Bdellovibrionaceae bacterium]|nr:hypothetical protein [Pseudobdellovibrionaceae bacterium]